MVPDGVGMDDGSIRFDMNVVKEGRTAVITQKQQAQQKAPYRNPFFHAHKESKSYRSKNTKKSEFSAFSGDSCGVCFSQGLASEIYTGLREGFKQAGTIGKALFTMNVEDRATGWRTEMKREGCEILLCEECPTVNSPQMGIVGEGWKLHLCTVRRL